MQLAARRYSVRQFSPEPIPQEILTDILQAGHLAPTAGNYQPRQIIVIESAEARAKLAICTKFHYDAPVALLVCSNKKICWVREADGKDRGNIDAAIVTTHMMLEATVHGIGTTWVMWFDVPALRQAYQIPPDVGPIALLVMGYPAETSQPAAWHSTYRPAEEIVSYNTFPVE